VGFLSVDKRLFFLLNMAQKKLFKHIDNMCEQELDASITQLAALMYIAKAPGCGQKDLAQALDLNKSAITGLIGRMEKNGLVQRAGSDDDARAVKLWPTPEGINKVERLKPLVDRLNNEFQQEFSAEEIATVLRFFNFILERF
jgi:DNA-binding MarR family transcriptional regulator